MAGIPSRLNQSSREQVLSSDINRIGNLTGREKMDQIKLRSVRADFYDPATNAFDDFTAAGKAAQGTPLAGLTKPPSLEGITSVFDMNIGAGEGAMPGTSSSADISDYQLLRWDAQRLTWPVGGTPDATNPLICLIYAIPADVPSDLQSRNILVDPLTRATVPANVYKTSNPVATISVVAGAAAAAPVAPAVPAGALALFEVFVPPLAADSTAFLPVRRAWRQIEFPGTSQHGIVKNCVPELSGTLRNLLLPTSATAIVHRIVIDGELLSFQGFGVVSAVADTNNAPVAGGHADFDQPAYLYLCGGRNAPCLNYSYALPGWQPIPVAFIVSLTPPDTLGYPTADLATATPVRTFPRAACCYIGVCFSAVGATTNVPAFYDGDWIRAAAWANFVQRDVTTPEAAYTAIPMPTLPATSTAMRVYAYVSGAASSFLRIATAAASANDIIYLGTTAVAGEMVADSVRKTNLYYKDLVTADVLHIRCIGFNMNVPRLSR
jgi:hypothetical protein